MLKEAMPISHLIYRWGWWVWYYRALALLTYVTIALAFLGFGDIIRDLVREPTGVNLLMIALIVLLLAVCALWGWSTWYQGGVRAVRIVVSADQQRLTVKTLNFTTRSVRLSDVERVEYSTMQRYATPNSFDKEQVYEPTLMVQVQHERPMRIDLQGYILDTDIFNTLFPHDPKRTQAVHRKKGRGRDVPAKR